MRIVEIRERIENIYGESKKDNEPVFYLSDYTVDENGKIIVNELLALDNNMSNVDISNNLILTDRFGNVLLNQRSDCFEYRYTILKVDNEEILIDKRKRVNNLELPKNSESVTLYQYKDGRLESIDELKDNNTERIVSTIWPCKDKKIVIVKSKKNDKDNAYLYSLEEKRVISPTFSSLEVVSDTDGKLLRFTDYAESNEKLDSNKLESEIIGYITVDGVLKNTLYDGRTNEVKTVELDTHPNFMQYKAFKNYLSNALDLDIEKENRRRFNKSLTLRNFEYNIKRNNNK